MVEQFVTTLGKTAMTESARRFPTDEEVEAWLAERHDASGVPVAVRDQVEAATRDTDAASAATVNLGRSLGLHGHLASEGPLPRAADLLAARMLMAAQSAGIKRYCTHVDQATPLFVLCDPPSVVCRNCMGEMADEITGQPFRWEHVCDACGSEEGLMYAVATNIGHIQVAGNVCRRCCDASTGNDAPA
jgi:hypothetical protein